MSNTTNRYSSALVKLFNDYYFLLITHYRASPFMFNTTLNDLPFLPSSQFKMRQDVEKASLAKEYLGFVCPRRNFSS